MSSIHNTKTFFLCKNDLKNHLFRDMSFQPTLILSNLQILKSRHNHKLSTLIWILNYRIFSLAFIVKYHFDFKYLVLVNQRSLIPRLFLTPSSLSNYIIYWILSILWSTAGVTRCRPKKVKTAWDGDDLRKSFE